MKWLCGSSRTCVLPFALLLSLLPAVLSADGLDGRKLLEPNPLTDWLGRRVRDAVIGRIGLTAPQIEEIRTVVDGHRDRLLAEVFYLKKARTELMAEVSAEEPDEDRLRRAHQLVSAAELQLVLHASELLVEVRAVMTPEQRAEARALADELEEGADLRFAEFERQLAAGELLGPRPSAAN